MSWDVILSKKAMKDVQHIKQAGLAKKLKVLLALLQDDPFTTPPRCEALVGNLNGFYSRRISMKHRLVYAVDMDKKMVHVLLCWTHYE